MASSTKSAKQNTQKIALWSPTFVTLVAYTFCQSSISQGLNSGNAVYLSFLGISTAAAGLLAACFSVGASVTRILIGPVVQKTTRRRLLYIGATMLTVGCFGPLFLNSVGALAVWRVCVGVGFGIGGTTAATAVAEVLPLSRLGEGISYHGLGQALSSAIGPALAIVLINTRPDNIFVGLGCFAILALLMVTLLRYEKNPSVLPETAVARTRWEEAQAKAQSAQNDSSTSDALKDCDGDAAISTSSNKKQAGRLSDATRSSDAAQTSEADKPRGIFVFFEPKALAGALPMFFMGLVCGFSIFFVSLYGTSIGVLNSGVYFTVAAITMVFSRLFINKCFDRIGPIKILLPATLCGLIGFTLLFCASRYTPLYYVAGLFWGFFMGIGNPLHNSVAVKNTPANRWGVTSSLFFLTIDMGSGLGAIIWGAIINAAGFSVCIICAQAVMVIMFIVAWFSYPGHGLKAMKPVELKDDESNLKHDA